MEEPDFDELEYLALDEDGLFDEGGNCMPPETAELEAICGESAVVPGKRPLGDPVEANKRQKASAPASASAAGGDDDLDMDDAELLELAAQGGGGGGGMMQPSSEGPPEEEDMDLVQMQMEEGQAGKRQPASSPFSPPVVLKARDLAPKRNPIDIEGERFAVTGPGGERVYCGMDGSRPTKAVTATSSLQIPGRAGSLHMGSLLGKPIRLLIEAVEQRRLQKAIDASARATSALTSPATGASINPEAELAKGGLADSMWVDKYSPKAFTELLSEEQTNREVLRWIKSWDHCVFGKPVPAKAHGPGGSGGGGGGGGGKFGGGHSKFKGRGGQGGGHGKFSNYGAVKFGGWNEKATELDADGRPRYKVLLMSGPPGLGKTTLAHVAAEHSGYRTVEVNASDDRATGALKNRIQDAVQMQAVMGNDTRPNLVVIDEIDGAMGGPEGQGAINALVQIINAGGAGAGAARGGEGEGGDDGKKKKRAQARRLQRPIICICNDLYAPALRPLREVALVYRLQPPSVTRITARLRQISEAEGLKVEGRALSALCDRTECDIRSCLHTLQFLRRRGQTLRMADVSALNVGRKDVTQSALRVWGEVFHSGTKAGAARTAAARKDAAPGGGAEGLGLVEFRRVHSAVEDFGDTDLLLTGCLENLHNMRFHDTHLNKTAECLEWMSVAQHLGNYRAYVPSAILAVRRIASTPDKVKLEWPSEYGRFRKSSAIAASVVSGWLARMAPAMRSGATKHLVVRDIAGPLVTTIQPQIRQVAPNLLTPKERGDIARVVGTMVGYGLTYTAASTEVHLEAMALHPAIDTLCEFGGKSNASRHPMPTNVQQMLAHEIDLEAIRRVDAKRGDVNPAAAPAAGSAAATKAAAAITPAGPPAAAPKGTWLDGFKNLGKKRTAAGRKGGASGSGGGNSGIGGNKVSHLPVVYKFNEGYTNAVRRPVSTAEFL